MDAVQEGLIDAICSDYYPPSILHSIFKLYHEQVLPLHEAVNLATLNPAKAAGIHGTHGSLEEGKNGDLIVVDIENGFPIVTTTVVNGHISSQHLPQPKKELAWQ